ncbi:Putative transcriptional regulatory protein [Tolypocladium paradoxum]|uniref:Transcriptional regulatory protein n=1 Tax=Tolypocladium paradoxum TaxID=94208 RepID=A0A2S4L096_9HYPO|nr:Putative transcriptional regulatory protein [Tolypocladium paradoxum]
MSSHPAAPHRHARVLACVLCQHRKIKCDRSFPCSNCVKANVTCTPSTPAPARKRRRPNQDLQERLARCEELLKQYAGGPGPADQQGQSPLTPVTSEVKPEPSDSTPMSTDTQQSWKPACKMINDEGGVRFMDSYIWASVYDELQAMRDIVETEDPEDSSILGSEDLTPDNNTDLFFPGDLSTANIEDLQPDPIHGFKLWQLFLDRVNPLTKVIHAPTVHPYVMEAATNMSNVPIHYQALLFSIYTMAVLSLSDTECIQMFGVSRDTALQKFTAGTKVALIRFNFLKNYNMSALQALVLYLYSLQGRYDRHAAWILSGTIVRIAQKMGYHRDGELLNLDPFETEMRRRVWWQIVIQDSKFAMMSGLSQSLLPLRWDTRLPQNVNDADIFQGSTEPVVPREGPTEMAFCLLLNEIYKFKMVTDNANDAPAFEAAVLGQDLEGNDDSSAMHQTTFDKFRFRAQQLELKLIELESRYVDVNAGSVHKAALTIRPMLTNKLSEMLVPMREQPEWGTEIFGPKDNLFKVVIMGNEHKLDAFERLMDTGFLWFVKLHFQLDLFAVMTGQLCQRPTGSLSDRGWAVVERVYAHLPELFDMSQKQYAVQAQFTLKAWKLREKAFMQAGQTIQTPQFVMRLRELVPNHDSRSSLQSSATPPMTLQPQQQPQQPQGQQKQQQQQLLQQLPLQFQPQSGDVDPFLGGYLDMPAFNWDMFGDMVGNSGDQLSAAMFGGLGIGNMPAMGNPGSF